MQHRKAMEVGTNPERRTETKVVEEEAEAEERVVQTQRSKHATIVVEQVMSRMIIEHSRRKETNYFVVIAIPMVMMKEHVLN